MKLLTEMCRDDNGEMYANDPDPYQAKGAVARDAACAHALMQAMDEIGGYTTKFIHARANSIMTGWGFDSGEAEE